MRVPIPRAAVERLRALSVTQRAAEAEAGGIVAGIAWALGFDRQRVTGFDDGAEPALLIDDTPLEE